ncbi:MerR family transcriptional regulator [Streptomyces tritici]|uniref:MerR family transcriptional regulator n=1 Tax=Streptomyces tritici TaxID=2054410 RepID=UPI003AF051E7
MSGEHLQIGEVAARTELPLRTIRSYEDAGLVVPSARSQGGFPLYTDADVARLMVIRRMRPLGFSLDETRDLLNAVDRLEAAESDPDFPAAERHRLIARVRRYEEAAETRMEELRAGLAKAEDFATSLRTRRQRAESLA